MAAATRKSCVEKRRRDFPPGRLIPNPGRIHSKGQVVKIFERLVCKVISPDKTYWIDADLSGGRTTADKSDSSKG